MKKALVILCLTVIISTILTSCNSGLTFSISKIEEHFDISFENTGDKEYSYHKGNEQYKCTAKSDNVIYLEYTSTLSSDVFIKDLSYLTASFDLYLQNLHLMDHPQAAVDAMSIITKCMDMMSLISEDDSYTDINKQNIEKAFNIVINGDVFSSNEWQIKATLNNKKISLVMEKK